MNFPPQIQDPQFSSSLKNTGDRARIWPETHYLRSSQHRQDSFIRAMKGMAREKAVPDDSISFNKSQASFK
ncbi:hypothetical protein SCA6_015037 [Theobroma cacao]